MPEIAAVFNVIAGGANLANQAQQTALSKESLDLQREQTNITGRQNVLQQRAQRRGDILQVEAAETNVEAIEAQIANRQSILQDDIQEFNTQTGQMLGQHGAALGASGGAIGAKMSSVTVEEDIKATRKEGLSRVEEQGAFDVEALEFEQQRQQNVIDVIEPTIGDEIPDWVDIKEPTPKPAATSPAEETGPAWEDEPISFVNETEETETQIDPTPMETLESPEETDIPDPLPPDPADTPWDMAEGN